MSVSLVTVVIDAEVTQGEDVIENKKAVTSRLRATAWLDSVAAADSLRVRWKSRILKHLLLVIPDQPAPCKTRSLQQCWALVGSELGVCADFRFRSSNCGSLRSLLY